MHHKGPAGSYEGSLLIADITGYTAFLSQSELDHAQDSLRTLIEVIIESSRPPLVLSKLEGDAVFTYAPAGAFIQGQSLVEAIEDIYLKFARALQRMILNTNCTCNACQNIPNLDLKFFVHHGNFALQTFNGRTELVGNDVILLHRLTKNAISAQTGLSAYAAYTQAVVDALELGEFASNLKRHREAYEHLGEVTLYVQDMRAVWKREQTRQSYGIREQDAKVRYQEDFPVPPMVLWGYLTDPFYRAMLMGADSQKLRGKERGRIGPGTVYQCAHGNRRIDQTVVEWRPFEEYTFDTVMPFLKGVLYRFTGRLTPTDTGTRFNVVGAPSQGSFLGRALANILVRIPPTVGDQLSKFRKQVEEDMEKRMQVPTQPVLPSSEDIAAEARAVLVNDAQIPPADLPSST